MRTFAITSAIAAVAAFASSVSAAVDCNPSYNVAPSTECFTNCNVKAGSAIIGTWTMDHTSPDFLPSLALMCNKSGANYSKFMMNAGICMAACAGDDPELFNAEFAGACAWYANHKNDKCPTDTTTTTKQSTTTTTTTTTTKTTSKATATGSTSSSTTTKVTGSSSTTTATGSSSTTTATGSSTTVAPTGAVTVTVTKTVTDCASPTTSVCQAGFKGTNIGRGPEGACCSTSDDCQETCVSGVCNKPIASTCYSGLEGKRLGQGYENACCKTSDDCWESCVHGKCNGPSLSSCDVGYSGKKARNGPKDACCNTSRDCKKSCVKGKCT